jgi:cytidine deaminase
MNERIIRVAQGYAVESTYKFRLGSVVFDRKGILGAGTNTPGKTHPKSKNPYKTRCAEFNAVMSAISRGFDLWDLRRSAIYTHRLKKDGTPGLAAPCSYCAEFLEEIGIKDIRYSL